MAQTKIDSNVDWKEPEREAPSKPENLPSSDDTEFWGKDAEKHSMSKREIRRQHKENFKQMQRHKFQAVDGEMVCVTCPHPHSMSIMP